METTVQSQQQPIRSTVPARLDRVRWTPFHTRLVVGLGAAWVLDGLSVTIASSLTSKLTQPNTLDLSTAQAASIGTVYLVGEVIGALVFGRMSDTLGRRKLFTWTLAIYLFGTALTALTPKGSGWIVYLYATRVIAGTGIGGEYSAINSAIDEMMPARYRGRTDVWINGTYWLGAIIGTFATFLLLSTLRTSEGWRICFLVGPALAFVIIFIRRNLPESPRWLITHGRVQEAEEAVRRIEEAALRDGQHLDPVPESAAITIVPERRYGYLTLLRVAFRQYPKRAILGATLMITQSFLYNAIFFTYALVLTKFYHVSNNAGPAVRPRIRGRQPGRPAVARPLVRQCRAQEDDLRHVPDIRGHARLQRLAVRRGDPVGRGADLHLDHHLLLRLRRGERRLPDGQRDLPDRD